MVHVLKLLPLCILLACGNDGKTETGDGGGSPDTDVDGDGDSDSDGDGDADSTYSGGGECVSASDCTLVSDCCGCLALGPGDTAPQCPPDPCFTDQCPVVGATEALCVGGHCVLNINCDSSTVTCRMATPVCDGGAIPIVDEAGTCWTQGCLAPDQCAAVTSCDDCLGGQACIEADGRSTCH